MRLLTEQELIDELAENGIRIHSTGGETADVGDLVRTILSILPSPLA